MCDSAICLCDRGGGWALSRGDTGAVHAPRVPSGGAIISGSRRIIDNTARVHARAVFAEFAWLVGGQIVLPRTAPVT